MKKPFIFDSIRKANNFAVSFVEKELQKFKLGTLKFSHYEIIRLLHIHKNMQLKDIASNIIKHKSTVTALIYKLEKLDYVVSTQSTKDKRKSFISLSEKGKTLKSFINSIEQKLLIHLHHKITPHEQSQIATQLNKLT